MASGANPGRFAKMELLWDGAWHNVPVVDISRNREISHIDITDHDSEDGETEHLPNLSNTTYDLTAKYKSASKGHRIIHDIADTKTRVLSRFYMKKHPGSDEPYWEGKVSVASEGTSGPLTEAGELSCALQGSLVKRYYQDNL